MMRPEEWFKQADYDMKSAEVLFENKRYIHAIFMCHLAIEKALKGLYLMRVDTVPPRTHSLLFLAEKIGLEIPLDLSGCFYDLNRLSVPTRYPDDLERMQKDYKEDLAHDILIKGREILLWLKTR